MATSGPGGMRQGLLQRVQFPLQQRPGAGDRREPANTVGGGLGPVRGAEGVHDEDVTQGRVGPGQLFAIFLFTRIEAHVFQHGDFAIGQRDAPAPVRHQADRLAQQTGEVSCHRRH